MRNTWAIFKKELRTYFVSPLFYVVAAVYLCLCGMRFWSDLAYFTQFGFGMNIQQNFWQLLFVDMQRVMLFTIPLLTMRLFAEERKLGTIEMLYTYPLRDGEILAGKFAACATVLLLILAATLFYPWYVYTEVYPVALGGVAAGYLGLFLLGLGFISCGLFVSSMTESQVIAGVGSIGLLLGLWAVAWNEAALSGIWRDVARAASTFEHFISFARGLIEAGAVAYNLSLAALFAVLTLRSMESRRWRGKR